MRGLILIRLTRNQVYFFSFRFVCITYTKITVFKTLISEQNYIEHLPTYKFDKRRRNILKKIVCESKSTNCYLSQRVRIAI